MNSHTRAGTGLHPALRAFPGAVLELAPDGVVLESNGCLERALERAVAGQRLDDLLDHASRLKLAEMLRRRPEPGEHPTPWELILEGRDTLSPHSFHPVWGDEQQGDEQQGDE